MMSNIPRSKDEFLMLAIRSYDPTCISMKEFRKDLRIIRKIKKDIQKWSNGNKINIRSLLNSFVIVFNQFGENATSLIMYDMDSDTRNLCCHFIIKLNRRCALVDKYQLNINEKLLSELYQI